MRPKLSVVLPTKDEEGVFDTIDSLRKRFGKDIELIVVDKSGPEFRERVRKTGVKLLVQKSRGVENAMIQGLSSARGDIIVSLDADGTHDISGISDGIRLIRQGKADLVLGNRLDGVEEGAMTAYLRFGNAMLSHIYNVFYRQHIHDLLTGLLVMRRSSFEKVKDRRPFEMPIAFCQIELARDGCKIEEVPIKYYKRKYGASRLTKSKFFYGFSTAWRIVRRSMDRVDR